MSSSSLVPLLLALLTVCAWSSLGVSAGTHLPSRAHHAVIRLQEDAAAAAAPRQAPHGWVHGMNNYTMNRPEGERHYMVYVPSSYDRSRPVSLVQALHGLGGSALSTMTSIGLPAASEKWQFILAVPEGTVTKYEQRKGWNAGTCCANETVDDMAFLSLMVDTLKDTFWIRNDSVHTMGHSNGGFMSERLACELGSVFTSAASVSGDTVMLPGNAGGLAACTAAYKSPVSLLHLHGNADPTVPWNGDSGIGFPSVPDNMAAWVSRNHCGNKPVQTLDQPAFVNQVWERCSVGNTTVELITHLGGNHDYPTPNSGGFDTTGYIMGFFDRNTHNGLR